MKKKYSTHVNAKIRKAIQECIDLISIMTTKEVFICEDLMYNPDRILPFLKFLSLRRGIVYKYAMITVLHTGYFDYADPKGDIDFIMNFVAPSLEECCKNYKSVKMKILKRQQIDMKMYDYCRYFLGNDDYFEENYCTDEDDDDEDYVEDEKLREKSDDEFFEKCIYKTNLNRTANMKTFPINDVGVIVDVEIKGIYTYLGIPVRFNYGTVSSSSYNDYLVIIKKMYNDYMNAMNADKSKYNLIINRHIFCVNYDYIKSMIDTDKKICNEFRNRIKNGDDDADDLYDEYLDNRANMLEDKGFDWYLADEMYGLLKKQ